MYLWTELSRAVRGNIWLEMMPYVPSAAWHQLVKGSLFLFKTLFINNVYNWRTRSLEISQAQKCTHTKIKIIKKVYEHTEHTHTCTRCFMYEQLASHIRHRFLNCKGNGHYASVNRSKSVENGVTDSPSRTKIKMLFHVSQLEQNAYLLQFLVFGYKKGPFLVSRSIKNFLCFSK